MSTIHGLSHKAIKHFRDKPAALAVYWIYCSRTNNEGVAWPSLRGLAESTGWNTTTVSKARKWLVEHGALERVSDYVRKAWRALPDADRRKAVGLDKSEYYRVTGTIEIDGTRHDLLYFGGHTVVDGFDNERAESPVLDAAELDADVDVPPGRTSTPSNIDAVDHLRGGTELDSNSQLDSTNQLDTTTSTSSSVDDDDEQSRMRAKVFQSYHANIGALTPIISDDLKDFIQEYGAQWVIDAIETSARNGARSIAYVTKVLQNWERHGRHAERPATPKGTGPVARPAVAAVGSGPSPHPHRSSVPRPPDAPDFITQMRRAGKL